MKATSSNLKIKWNLFGGQWVLSHAGDNALGEVHSELKCQLQGVCSETIWSIMWLNKNQSLMFMDPKTIHKSNKQTNK